MGPPAFILSAVWMASVYDRVPFAAGKLLTWVMLGRLVWWLHRSIDERGLPVEIAPAADWQP